MTETTFKETISTKHCENAVEVMQEVERTMSRLRSDAADVAKERIYQRGHFNGEIKVLVNHNVGKDCVDIVVFLADYGLICADEVEAANAT